MNPAKSSTTDHWIHAPEDYEPIFKKINSLNSEQIIVLLRGTLGVGKTFFVRSYLENKGVPLKEMSSPTFALIHRYLSLQKSPIYHVDLYRIQDEADLESTGFWDLLRENKYLMFVEWADKIEGDWWPSKAQVVELLFKMPEGQQIESSRSVGARFEPRQVKITVLN